MLKQHKGAIGWIIVDLRGIDTSICTHQIFLEEDTRPIRQCKGILILQEVVKKEVLKLLDVGLIYPISDSKWVTQTQVVPKKAGIIVVPNTNCIKVVIE